MMDALQADASRLLAEYDSSNSAGNRLQRRLLSCEHAFHLLNDRFSHYYHHTSGSIFYFFPVGGHDVLNQA